MSLFLPYNDIDRQRAQEKLQDLISRRVPFRIEEVFPQRTPRQGRYFFLLRDYFASVHGLSRKEVEDKIIKRECNPDIFIRLETDKDGKTKEYIRKTDTLSTKEMALVITRFKYHALTKYETYLPDAESDMDMLSCEQEIERNKEFL